MSGLRKDEILAKKAKLLEIKRQRELRDTDDTPSRHSIKEEDEVRAQLDFDYGIVLIVDIASFTYTLTWRPPQRPGPLRYQYNRAK